MKRATVVTVAVVALVVVYATMSVWLQQQVAVHSGFVSEDVGRRTATRLPPTVSSTTSTALKTTDASTLASLVTSTPPTAARTTVAFALTPDYPASNDTNKDVHALNESRLFRLTDLTSVEPPSSSLNANLQLAKGVQFTMPSILRYGHRLFMVVRIVLEEPSVQQRCPAERLRQAPGECTGAVSRIVYLSYTAVVPMTPAFELDGHVSPEFPHLSLHDNGWNWDRLATIEQGNAYVGYEDARVFYWPTPEKQRRTFLIGNSVYHTSSHSARLMFIKQVLPDEGDSVFLLPADPLNAKRQFDTQKNWSPIGPTPDGNEYLFSQQLEPHIVQACSLAGVCRLYAKTSSAAIPSTPHHHAWYAHLGTNAALLNSGDYIGVFHWKYGAASFQNHYYLFDGKYPYRIKAVSMSPIVVSEAGFYYASSLARVDNQYILAGHVSDHAVLLVPLNISDVIRTLTYI